MYVTCVLLAQCQCSATGWMKVRQWFISMQNIKQGELLWKGQIRYWSALVLQMYATRMRDTHTHTLNPQPSDSPSLLKRIRCWKCAGDSCFLGFMVYTAVMKQQKKWNSHGINKVGLKSNNNNYITSCHFSALLDHCMITCCCLKIRTENESGEWIHGIDGVKWNNSCLVAVYLTKLCPGFLLFHPAMSHQIIKHLTCNEKAEGCQVLCRFFELS